MSKKKRQSRKSTKKATTAQVRTGRTSVTSEMEFNPDYSQTIKDLKRIGILASSFFVVLVVLSFFLR